MDTLSEASDSDGSLTWDEFYGSLAADDLESTLLGMYDALKEKSSTDIVLRKDTMGEVAPPRPHSTKTHHKRWNCRCSGKAASLVVTRCAACAQVRSTDIRDSLILDTASPPPVRRASLADPQQSCYLLTCPVSPAARRASRTPEPVRSSFAEKRRFDAINHAPLATPSPPSSLAIPSREELRCSAREKEAVQPPTITTMLSPSAVSPLALKRIRGQSGCGVTRPLSLSSIASSSSSSSSGGSLSRLAPPNKSRYLASIESFEDVSETERRKSGSGRAAPGEWFKCDESQGSADSGVHSSCSMSPVRARYSDPQMSYMDRVVLEIVETEQVYVRDLQTIVEGYLHYWQSDANLSLVNRLPELFGNLEDIYHFNSLFLKDLEQCGLDPVKVAQCFVRNNVGFSVYTEYCTNYPRSVTLLTELMRQEETVELFRERQTVLHQTLPLGSYLLKPVQRILKYHLLLQNIVKQSVKEVVGYADMEDALTAMTAIAQHINDMKRRHEHAVRVQEIQSLLDGWQGEDLTRLGELCAEGTFRLCGAKALRHIFLFDKALLITKKKEEGVLGYKAHIDCCNLMLIESVPGEPLSFHVIPFDNPRLQYTMQARNLEQKREWTLQIKRVILENYNAVIPSHARQLVMELGQTRLDGTGTPDKTMSRKQHSAPEYLERRKQDRRKTDVGFRARLRRTRKSDAGGVSLSQQRPAGDVEKETPHRRRQSEPSPRGSLTHPANPPLNNSLLTTAAASAEQVSIDLTSSEEVRTIEQIVGQLLMQNREFEKILKKQKEEVNFRSEPSAADSVSGITDDEEDAIYETLLNVNMLLTRDISEDSDDYVTINSSAVKSPCQQQQPADKPPVRRTGSFNHSDSFLKHLEPTTSLEKLTIPTLPAVWLQQQGQHLVVPTKKAGSLPRSFQINIEGGSDDTFKDARNSVERPFTIASDRPNAMLYDERYSRPFPLPGEADEDTLTEVGSTPGASMDHIDLHPSNRIYRSGVATSTLKNAISSVSNRLAHLTVDLTPRSAPDSSRALQWERKASRLVNVLARQCRKTLRSRIKSASSCQDVASPNSLPVFMQGSSYLGARLACSNPTFERVRPKAAALLGLDPGSFVSLSSSMCSISAKTESENDCSDVMVNSTDNLSPIDDTIGSESDASIDSFYERSFDAIDDHLEKNHPALSDPEERFTDEEQRLYESEGEDSQTTEMSPMISSEDSNEAISDEIPPVASSESGEPESGIKILVGGVEEDVFKRSKSIRERQRELEQWRLQKQGNGSSSAEVDDGDSRPRGWVRHVVKKIQDGENKTDVPNH